MAIGQIETVNDSGHLMRVDERSWEYARSAFATAYCVGEAEAQAVLAGSAQQEGEDGSGHGGPAEVLVGMPSVESTDYRAVANPLDAVVTIPVRYPMVLDTPVGWGCRVDEDDELFEGVEISDFDDLRRWAEAQFDYYDIRPL